MGLDVPWSASPPMSPPPAILRLRHTPERNVLASKPSSRRKHTASALRVQDMGAEQSAPAEEWPPGWSAMTSEKQKTARGLILGISAEPRTDFLAIADASYCIPAAEWRFEQYHAAATAAVQEDQKLNRCVYCLVPRHLSESDFWRLYFSKTLAILDSVKTHGTFPPPAPKAVAKKKKAKAAAAPPPEDDSYCAVQ